MRSLGSLRVLIEERLAVEEILDFVDSVVLRDFLVPVALLAVEVYLDILAVMGVEV